MPSDAETAAEEASAGDVFRTEPGAWTPWPEPPAVSMVWLGMM